MSGNVAPLLANAHLPDMPATAIVRSDELVAVSFDMPYIQISAPVPVTSVPIPVESYRLNEARFHALTVTVGAIRETSNTVGCDPLPGCTDRLTQCALKCGRSVITRSLPYGKQICGAVIACLTLTAAFTVTAVFADN